MLTGVSSYQNSMVYPQPVVPTSMATNSSTNTAFVINHDQVTLSNEGKALLYALQEIEKENHYKQESDRDMSEQVESFAHGALGINPPSALEEENDTSYSAGQYVSAALTVGGILLALV
ncbi:MULTISPECIES: hypothetical protein [Aliivibrio]|uniref:hypothetical protein n=1 Tax=Aliivibrio TaxID=511678 RepID=UPI0015F78DA9|nr:hypothetical protein [Aliivibrio sp. SR45-2]MBB1313622.1 hypothetical protein [Aliivibrio sp. SR45-2]